MQLKDSVQKQHNRGLGLLFLGPCEIWAFFTDFYIMYESFCCICKNKGRWL